MARCSPVRSRLPVTASLMLAALWLAPGVPVAAQTAGTAGPVRHDIPQPTTVLLATDRLAAPGMPKPVAPALPELGVVDGSSRLRSGTYDVLGSYVQLEMPRDLGDGRYTRPKVRFGMQSASLKSWATSIGLQPERCTLPTVRARSKVSSEDINGSVMLLARCSFY